MHRSSFPFSPSLSWGSRLCALRAKSEPLVLALSFRICAALPASIVECRLIAAHGSAVPALGCFCTENAHMNVAGDAHMNVAHMSVAAQDSGVRKGNGDGTVPLTSLGIHCRSGWKTKKLNPSGIDIKTRELKHSPVPMYQDPRCVPSC